MCFDSDLSQEVASEQGELQGSMSKVTKLEAELGVVKDELEQEKRRTKELLEKVRYSTIRMLKDLSLL